MDADEAGDLRTDDEMTATPESAAEAHTDARLLDTHTCLPGIIVSFNPATQTAQVQPAIKRIFIDVGAVDLPICVDVPVQFPRGGNFVLTFPVAPGDECLLVFSERAIDFWWDQGGVQLPSEFRLHDLSDAFAIMGVSSRPKMITSFNTAACELRTVEAGAYVRVEGTRVKADAAEVNLNAETRVTADAAEVNLNAGTQGVARVNDDVTLVIPGTPPSAADGIYVLAYALAATGVFVLNPSPPPPSALPPTVLHGSIASGSSSVKAGG